MRNYGEFNPAAYRAAIGRESEQHSDIRGRLKKAALKAVALSMMFGSHMVGYGQSLRSETRPRIVATAEKIENKPKVFSPAEIRRKLPTDPYERVFISTNADHANQLSEIPGGRATSGYLDYSDIDRLLNDKGPSVTQFKVTHTHPERAYEYVFKTGNVSAEDQLDYREGKKKLPPHPPSIADFSSQSRLQKNYGPKHLAVESEVIDATGTWNYSVTNKNEMLTTLRAIQEEQAEQMERRLSRDQLDTVDKVLENPEVDPRGLGSFLANQTAEQDPTGEHRKIGQILLELQNEMENKYRQYTELFRKFESVGMAVVLAKTPGERDAAIANYIALCREHGINLSYTPAAD
jgi:hypothetical protein